MAESFFTSGNQIVTTEIDVDSPVTEGWMSKVKGRDVELSDKIIGLGGTGADGDVTITANTNLSGIKHYNNFTINAGVTVTVDQGKPLIIFARGTVTINGTIDGNGKGGQGGGSTSAGGDAIGGGAGGAAVSDGGNSEYIYKSFGGVVGGPIDGNPAPSSKFLTIPIYPSMNPLGGAGGGKGSPGGGTGSNGGGFVFIESPTVIIGTGGIIRCNGIDGGDNTGNFYGGGAGGGGVIYIRRKNYTNNGSVTANGGTGGDGRDASGVIDPAFRGGNGGVGVVYSEVIP